MMKTLVIMSLVVHLHQETRLTTRRQNLVLIPIRKSRGKTSMRESFMNLQNSLFVFSLQPLLMIRSLILDRWRFHLKGLSPVVEQL